MKNKPIKILISLFIVFVFSFISGCIPEPCPAPVLYYFREVNVKPLDRIEQPDGTVDFVATDTIRNEIAFEVSPTVEIAAATTKMTNGLMNMAYGECNSSLSLNPIDHSKSKMYINRDLYFDGGFIPAGENFLTHPVFRELVNFPTTLSYEGVAFITLDNVPLRLFNDNYTFSFEWTTSDGILLKEVVDIYIRK